MFVSFKIALGKFSKVSLNVTTLFIDIALFHYVTRYSLCQNIYLQKKHLIVLYHEIVPTEYR